MSAAELDRCLEKLRYASKGEYVLAEDVNVKAECSRLLRVALAERAPGDPLVDELDAILAKVRYVRAGDIIEPEDHNYLVDALRKARDILARLEDEYRVRLEAVEYALKYKQPVYEFTLGIDASPHGRLPEPLRLVGVPPLTPLVELKAFVSYTLPRVELLPGPFELVEVPPLVPLPPAPLRLVEVPRLVTLVEQRVYVGYTSPRTEILVEVKSGG